MGIQITTEQITTMAPDSSSASAARKLNNTKHWQNLGQSSEALWGECKGSALYQVRIAVPTLTVQCTCPSRKQPCKHGLGLLLLAASDPAAVPESEQPEWITSWLAKRAATTKRKETLQQKSADEPPSAAQRKTAEKRLEKVKGGIEQLDLWLSDLVRNGLGSVEGKANSFWEQQAAQLVDAQAPGLAGRIRRMAGVPLASSDWPERLLAQLGQLALLTQAFQRLDALEPGLQEEVRQLIGWNLKEDEVIERGERVQDTWLFLGQQVEEVERGKTQRTWLLGLDSGRIALLSEFVLSQQSFSKHYALGTCRRASVAYWPGVATQRAVLLHENETQVETSALPAQLPGAASIPDFLVSTSTQLALQPWREYFPGVLQNVVLIHQRESSAWWIRDQQGKGLPLGGNSELYWNLLAHTGGHAVDVAGQWNGETFLPFGLLADSNYIPCKQ